jgi:hypothetical protein
MSEFIIAVVAITFFILGFALSELRNLVSRFVLQRDYITAQREIENLREAIFAAAPSRSADGQEDGADIRIHVPASSSPKVLKTSAHL